LDISLDILVFSEFVKLEMNNEDDINANNKIFFIGMLDYKI
jgi:hypothetical protein